MTNNESKTEVKFTVTSKKTEVTAIGSKGNSETTIITGTEIEKEFVRLLKKLKEHNQTNLILDAIDINKFSESPNSKTSGVRDIEKLREEYVNHFADQVNYSGEGGDFTPKLLYAVFDWFLLNIQPKVEGIVPDDFLKSLINDRRIGIELGANKLEIELLDNIIQRYSLFHLQSKGEGVVTDEMINDFAKGRYTITYMCKGQHKCDLLNLQDAVIYGAKWMRDKLQLPDTTKEAVDFCRCEECPSRTLNEVELCCCCDKPIRKK